MIPVAGIRYFTAFGCIALLILAVKSGALRPVTRTLAYVGQMAFSNSILTSLICTTVFEGLRIRPLRLARHPHLEPDLAPPLPLRPPRMGMALADLLEEAALPHPRTGPGLAMAGFSALDHEGLIGANFPHEKSL
jgi:hypothetical protein